MSVCRGGRFTCSLARSLDASAACLPAWLAHEAVRYAIHAIKLGSRCFFRLCVSECKRVCCVCACVAPKRPSSSMIIEIVLQQQRQCQPTAHSVLLMMNEYLNVRLAGVRLPSNDGLCGRTSPECGLNISDGCGIETRKEKRVLSNLYDPMRTVSLSTAASVSEFSLRRSDILWSGHFRRNTLPSSTDVLL